MLKFVILNIVLIFAFGNTVWAEIVEISPVQRRYYLESKINLEAIPNYDIEDEGTSPTKKIFNLHSVVFSDEYPLENSSNFDSREYCISAVSGKKAKANGIRKKAETISKSKANKKNSKFKHDKTNRILYQIGGYLIMYNIGFEKGNFKYEKEPDKYFHGRDHRPEWYIYIPYNFHHPYVIPTNIPVGEYKLPIISIIRESKRDGKSPIKLLDLHIDNIQKDGDKSIISWHIPETELGIYEKMNSKRETLFYQEFFSAEGQMTCDLEGVIQKYHADIYHDMYLNQIHTEKYHRATKGVLLNSKDLKDTRKFKLNEE